MEELFAIPEHGTGAILSGDSEKDYKMGDYIVAGAATTTPNSFCYDPIPVINQGNVGSCVAHAEEALKRFMEKKERGEMEYWSTDFLYHNRTNDDYQGEGMMLRQALNQLKNHGVCQKSLYPTNTDYSKGRNTTITKPMLDNALNQKVKSYARVNLNNKEEVKRTLIENGPTIISIPMCNSFSSHYPTIFNKPIKDYVIYNGNGNANSYHAILVIGYRMIGSYIEYKIQNSWGDLWGDKGCSWLSFDYPIEEMWSVIDEYLPPVAKQKVIKFTMGSNEYTVNDTRYIMDTVPVQSDNRTFIPLRFVAAALSCSVEYVPENMSVRVYDYSKGLFTFYIGKDYYLDGTAHKVIKMDVRTYSDSSNRTMVPLRAVSEALGFEVSWNRVENSITITK